MNRIYRSIWNDKTRTYVAVAETAKSAGKKASSTSASGGVRFALNTLTSSMLLAFGSLALAQPLDGQVTAGSASIAQNGTTTTITQTSQNAALNWQSFNIGATETVRFNQPNTNAIALNRVIGNNATSIYGNLSANGKVFLVNPNGILFGQGASINVGGLIASTRNISDADFMAGRYKFSGTGNGTVRNQGNINAEGGYIALLGANVSNEGTLSARLGTVILAAGESMTLDVVGDGLLNIAIDRGSVNALINNGGLIKADGGQVLLTTQAAGQLLNSVVNNTGIIQAQTLQNKSGVIKLLGDMQSGTVNVGGTLDASAPTLPASNGGFIETSAAHVKIANDVKITTSAPNGLTGSWLIDPQDYTIAASGGDITGAALSTQLAGTNVTILSTNGATAGNGDIFVNDNVSWSANLLTLNAFRNIAINSTMTATGTASLALVYGQGAVALNNTSTISTGTTGVVNLPAGTTNFTTKQGSDGVVKAYTVITSLGVAGSVSTTDLQGMSGNVTLNYALGANIAATGTSTWNANAGFTPVGNIVSPFTGTFDGLGHTISTLTINRPTTNNVGLFGFTNLTGVIRNVGLVGGSVTGGINVGGLVGVNSGGNISTSYATGAVSGSANVGGLVGYNIGSISSSYATGAVTGSVDSVGGLVGRNTSTISSSYATGWVSGMANSVGGLVGYNSGGRISSSYATGAVSGGAFVGGLAGYGLNCSISSSYATGAVTGGGSVVGGLVGYGYGGSISSSYATGAVSGSANVGGLVGQNGGSSISSSYATGAVTGNSYVGGLVGGNRGNISASYATGSVSGVSKVGGLVGQNVLSTISTSYATGAVSGSSLVGGLVGINTGSISTSYWNTTTSGRATSAGGTGLSTAQMQTQANFTSATAANGNVNPNWNFANTWVMYEGHTAPLLRSFMTALTVTATGGSKGYDGVAGNGVSYSATPNANLLGTLNYGASANAGSYTTALSGLYSNQQGYIISYVNSSLTVTPKALTITGMTASSKVYDGSTSATLSGGALSGLVGTETLNISGTGTFANANVGTGKSVTVTGITLSNGTGLASNYSVANPTGLTADITRKALTITGMTASSKVYDGSTSATLSGGSLSGLVGTETLNISGTGAFADANVGTAKAVTVSGTTLTDGTGLASNYSVMNPTGLTADITRKALTVTGMTASNKVYDGSTNAALVGGSLSGLVGTETLTFSGQTGAFANANVGTAKAVTVSGTTLSNGTGLASNYSISNPSDLTADITPVPELVTANTSTTNTIAAAVANAVTSAKPVMSQATSNSPVIAANMNSAFSGASTGSALGALGGVGTTPMSGTPIPMSGTPLLPAGANPATPSLAAPNAATPVAAVNSTGGSSAAVTSEPATRSASAGSTNEGSAGTTNGARPATGNEGGATDTKTGSGSNSSKGNDSTSSKSEEGATKETNTRKRRPI